MYTVQYGNTPDLVIFVAETVRYRSQGAERWLTQRQNWKEVWSHARKNHDLKSTVPASDPMPF